MGYPAIKARIAPCEGIRSNKLMSLFHISLLPSTSHTLNNLLEIFRPSLLSRIFLSFTTLPTKRRQQPRRLYGADENAGAYYHGFIIDKARRDREIDSACVEPSSDSETDPSHDFAIPAELHLPSKSPPRPLPPNRNRATRMSNRGPSSDGSTHSWGHTNDISPHRNHPSPRRPHNDRVRFSSSNILFFFSLFEETSSHRNRRRQNDRRHDSGDVTPNI